jgi:mycofactocin precursor
MMDGEIIRFSCDRKWEDVMKNKMHDEKTELQDETKENQDFSDDGAFFTKETIVEEMAIDGICGVY